MVPVASRINLPKRTTIVHKKKDVSSCRAARRATNSLLCHLHALSDAMSDVVAAVFTTECLPRPRLHEVSARHLR